MPALSDFQNARGTALATFGQNGTYSSLVDMGGLRLVGIYSHNYPAAAGSVTFRAVWDASGSGTGFPVADNAGVPYRVTSFGSGTYYSFVLGTVPMAAQYVRLEVGTAGTPGVAAGGTIVIVGMA